MDPNDAVRPNYALEEFQEERQQLIGEGLTEEQAIRLRKTTPKDCQDLRDEEEAARLEDRKKNKNKYAPLKRTKVPTDPTILPAQYAIRRLKAGDYCELHYFTNKGLDEAMALTLVAEPDALVMLPASDGIHSWVPAAAVKDPKAAPVTKDEHLTWEEFNEAAPRIVVFMKMHDWPDDRVNMHIQFWTAIQAHRWRHSPDPLQQRALLLYQSQQRRRWHLTIGTAQGWSLEEINQDLLFEARELLFNEKRDKDTALAIQQAAAAFVASSANSLRTQLATSTQQPQAALKRAAPFNEESGGNNKKCALGATRTEPSSAWPPKRGTNNMRPSQNESAKDCGPKTGNNSVLPGSVKKVAQVRRPISWSPEVRSSTEGRIL
ncbi:hypothetical protein DFJ58DRAFT_909995 [Suillus subalutaceus]|uniref:uncharacterized protein n=1 Tax=Suillus subalutaceus TaxID=48586 RepID=UPI001B882E71|nr:uncharacterized protein DFJ58DRAFT_909995 [Suillus subalutaceus]KAG1875508.1 hypothetical protein DFJ58DRAFT_909995 [Suillus subalutaceus]